MQGKATRFESPHSAAWVALRASEVQPAAVVTVLQPRPADEFLARKQNIDDLAGQLEPLNAKYSNTVLALAQQADQLRARSVKYRRAVKALSQQAREFAARSAKYRQVVKALGRAEVELEAAAGVAGDLRHQISLLSVRVRALQAELNDERARRHALEEQLGCARTA